MCQSQRIPVAYWETTRSTMAKEKAQPRAHIFSCARRSPVAATCIDRMVMAVADGVGKMSFSSLAR